MPARDRAGKARDRTRPPHPVGRPQPPEPLEPPEPSREPGSDLPSWGELYTTTVELSLRAQTGGAEAVLTEAPEVLRAAREAGAERIVYQLLYIQALSNLQLGRFQECVGICADLTRELSDDPIDRSWMSSSASMRALVAIIQHERQLALREVIEAAIHLNDAPPRGLSYIWAVNVLGVAYLSLRLYELALAHYDGLADDASVTAYPISALYRVLNSQLAHLYLGLELDRIGSPEALQHFRQALELGKQAMELLPRQDPASWELVLNARSGMCLAFLGDADTAAALLAEVIEPLSRNEADDAVVARLGLVRAHSSHSVGTALAHAERALLSISHTTDYALVMGAVWERARLYINEPSVETAATYAQLLARTSWRDRSQLAATMGARIATETMRRQEDRATERLLYDAATGLVSRLSFLQQLSARVRDAERTGDQVCVGFLEVSAESFDDALDKIIATLQVDVLARYDHRELAVIAVGVSGDLLESRIRACGDDVVSHLTGGIASLSPPTSTAGLIMHADEALHIARRAGGLQVNRH